jgi:nucleoside-diphosphate-sugar epimerase
MNDQPHVVLILGAHGRLGSALVAAFARAGWQVRAQARHPGAWPARVPPVLCDATDAQALQRAAAGVEVIVHALNPSRYTLGTWRREVGQMLAHAVAAARVSGALLMLPGNVYNFGSRLPTRLDEATPEAADTPFGVIRRDMEASVAAASVDSVVLRAGEFFGGGRGVWFDQIIVRDVGRGIVRYPGPPDRLHAWTYVPDLAETFVQVAARRSELRGFHRFHVPGHACTGAELAAALSGAVGRPLALRAMSWRALGVARVFSPMMRALWTMRYLWQRPHFLDGQALTQWLGSMPHTELDTALRRALAELDMPPAGLAAARRQA